MCSNLLTPLEFEPTLAGVANFRPSDSAAHVAQPAPMPRSTNVAPIRILVVEDDPRSARLLLAGLSSAGYEVAHVSTAEEAQARVLSARPDLVVCDVCLPDVDGIELTRRLRAGESALGIPILLVTSLDDRKVLSRSLEAGADDFLTKPVNTVELRARVRSLLRDKPRVDALREFDTPPASPGAAESALPDQVDSAAAKSTTDGDGHTVLIVEDDERECRLIESHLSNGHSRVLTARVAGTAWELLNGESVDLVLLDLVLPDCDGYAIIEQLRTSARHAHTPILVVSALSGVDDRVKALELGADDFVLKGADRSELQARVRRLLRRKQSLDRLTARCDDALRLAVTDGLTGFFTHGYLQDVLERQVATAQRMERPLSVLFLDIDYFKKINDRYGHAVGDEVLQSLARTITGCLRENDVGVRYGGEEFVVVLPETPLAEAAKVAERIRLAAETLSVPCPRMPAGLRLTVSIGVAAAARDTANAAVLLQHADEAMYTAKRTGRNQVIVFENPAEAAVPGGRILLVDDDDRNLRLLEAYLAHEGHELLLARNGMEALAIARDEQPDLILLDGMMPQLSGFDVCRRLKQDAATTLIPIVLVSALRDREDRIRSIEAGADDFLTKPVDRVELLARTRALLRTKRCTDSLEDAEVVIFALAKAVESRDPSTGGHVERVSHYAVALGRALDLSALEIDALRRAGVVHDIGKVAVPDAVMLKPGKLTPEERAIMQTHVEAGYEMLRPMRTFRECLPAVRFHHERLDGSGYPLGLRGDEVPLMAQIMGIVDVFDALTTDRVYRAAMSYQEALDVLRDETRRGLHNPRLLSAFEQVLSESR